MWSIYQYTSVNENGSIAQHIEDYGYYEDAVRAIYRLNGWGEPKNITKRF